MPRWTLADTLSLIALLVLMYLLSDCDWLRPMIYCPQYWRYF